MTMTLDVGKQYGVVAFSVQPKTKKTPAIRVGRTWLGAKKTATFGMGCFWEPAESLLEVEGVLGTVAGYTGVVDPTKKPTYDSVCFGRQWVEGVRVTYDDEVLSYAELLDRFEEAQNPKMGSRQYASIVFTTNDDERRLASQWLQNAQENEQVTGGWPAKLTTIESSTPFFRAEGWHQNYWKKFRTRAAIVVLLLVLSSGGLDRLHMFQDAPELQDMIETGALALVVGGGLATLLERVIDTNVMELE
jgi:methionine-S-sulfoxide reductase